jgi:hypothetical protein
VAHNNYFDKYFGDCPLFQLLHTYRFENIFFFSSDNRVRARSCTLVGSFEKLARSPGQGLDAISE